MTLTVSPPEINTRDILSSIGNAVFLVGPNDSVAYANQHLADLLGSTPEKLTGLPYHVLFNQIAARSKDSSTTLNRLSSAANQIRQYPHGELVFGKPSLGQFHFTLFPLPGDDGRTSWGGILQSTSSEPGRNEHRTKVFLNLIDELRSSLVFIVGCASTLLSDHFSWSKEELDSFLKTINTNAQDTIQLLENVRDISKLDLKELDLRTRPINLERLVQFVAHNLADDGNYLDLKLDIVDNLPMVEVDTIRMSRAFQHLMSSILKLSFGSTIQLSARQVDSRVQIEIIYHGNQLPDILHAEEMDEILQNRSQKPQMVRDLGLRLYIAQGIIQAHGGKLWTEASRDQKVTIHVGLPLKRHTTSTLPSATTAVDQSQQLEKGTARASKPNTTVLVIEQNTRVSQQLKSQLGAEGYHVVCTGEGRMGLDLAAIEVPDVILLSTQLPDADALSICKDLRDFTAVPILMLAENSDEDAIIQSLDAGADEYIVKPIRTKELQARIQANLRRAYLSDTTDKSNGETSLQAGDLTIDFVQRKVLRGDEVVNLTPIEYRLLHHLAMNAGRILTHEQLVTKVWGPVFRGETQYLWVNISRLRAKIEDDPSKPQYILTERGVGYTFYNPGEDRKVNHNSGNGRTYHAG